MRNLSPRIQGFTLLELLVVVTLMAVLASVALLSNEGVRDRAEVDATQYEMAELRKALLQFRRDVGHFPDAAGLIAGGDRLALLLACQSTDATKINTTLGVSYDADCESWNPDTRRGWNGPYVSAEGARDQFSINSGPGQNYVLLEPASTAPLTTTARIVSYGPNGAYEGDHATDKCQKKDSGSDDIVMCLLK